jgi:RluA family pseudouridine synthase
MTLRNLLVRRMPRTDKDRAVRLIKAGGVYVNKLRVRLPTVRVSAGERVTVYPVAETIEPLDPESLVVAHRDPHFLVIDKAPGIPVAPTKQAAVGTISEALIHWLEARGVTRPYVGIVHRLDRGASGLVVFTTRSVANKSFHQQFVDHTIHREYRLEVHGQPPASMRCDAPLRMTRAQTVQVVDPGTQGAVSASTSFRRLEARAETALLEAALETGRTHQIRAHVAHLGHPVVGDARYGSEGGDELRLHAHRLRFDHPLTGTPIEIESTLPGWARNEHSG